MKKILVALLVVMSIFALVSCSSGESATSITLNAANDYSQTTTLSKTPTSGCAVYYKSGSTASGYVLAEGGIVPVFDANNALIGNVVAKYSTDKLLSLVFVGTAAQSASGSVEITVGVLTGTSMDSYGKYNVKVDYTKIGPTSTPINLTAINDYAAEKEIKKTDGEELYYSLDGIRLIAIEEGEAPVYNTSGEQFGWIDVAVIPGDGDVNKITFAFEPIFSARDSFGKVAIYTATSEVAVASKATNEFDVIVIYQYEPIPKPTDVVLSQYNEYTKEVAFDKAAAKDDDVYYIEDGSIKKANAGFVPVYTAEAELIGYVDVTIPEAGATKTSMTFGVSEGITSDKAGSAKIFVGSYSEEKGIKLCGRYNVAVAYTYQEPPVEPITTDLYLYIEPDFADGYTKGSDSDYSEFVATADEVLAFIGSGSDYSKYYVIGADTSKKTLSSVQEMSLDDFTDLTVTIDKVGSYRKVVYTVEYAIGGNLYPAAESYYALDNGTNIVIAGFTKDSEGIVRIDTSKIELVNRVQTIKREARELDVTIYENAGLNLRDTAELLGDIDVNKLALYKDGVKFCGFVGTQTADVYVNDKEYEVTGGTLYFEYNNSSNQMKIALVGDDDGKGTEKLSLVEENGVGGYVVFASFNLSYVSEPGDAKTATMKVNPWMGDYVLPYDFSGYTVKYWNADLATPAWVDFPTEGKTIELVDSGYGDKIYAALKLVGGEFVLSVSNWSTVGWKNQSRTADDLLIGVFNGDGSLVERWKLSFAQNYVNKVELAYSGTSGYGYAVDMVANYDAPATSSAFAGGQAMQFKEGGAWVDIDEVYTSETDKKAKLTYTAGELKLDLYKLVGGQTLSTKTFASECVTSGSYDVYGDKKVYVAENVYVKKSGSTTTAGVLKLSQDSTVISSSAINVGAKILAPATTSVQLSADAETTLFAKYMNTTTNTWDAVDASGIGITIKGSKVRKNAAKLAFESGEYTSLTKLQAGKFTLSIVNGADENASGDLPDIILGYYKDGKFVTKYYYVARTDAQIQQQHSVLSSPVISMSSETLKGEAAVGSYDKAYYMVGDLWTEFTAKEVVFYTSSEHIEEGAAKLSFTAKDATTQAKFTVEGYTGGTYTTGSVTKAEEFIVGTVGTDGTFTPSGAVNVSARVN